MQNMTRASSSWSNYTLPIRTLWQNSLKFWFQSSCSQIHLRRAFCWESSLSRPCKKPIMCWLTQLKSESSLHCLFTKISQGHCLLLIRKVDLLKSPERVNTLLLEIFLIIQDWDFLKLFLMMIKKVIRISRIIWTTLKRDSIKMT